MKTILNNTSIQVSLAAIEQNLWNDVESREIIKLNCNESPFDIPQVLKQQLTSKMAELSWNRYPDFQQTELSTLLANSVGLKSENILLGNGSSQLIQQIINCCSTFVSEVIIENPTFTLYHQICQNARLNYREWNLNEDGSFDSTNFPSVTEPALVIITSPNNPTGAILPINKLRNLLQTHPECIFLVDEAYGEFTNESAIELINDFSNLLVLRTFSKGFGLPSARFGYALGNKTLIDSIRKHTIPFTINVFTELIAKEFLTNPVLKTVLQINRERIINVRDFIYFLLNQIADEQSFSIQPSASNFLLLRFQNAELLEQIKNVFQQRNILVSYPLPNCLRLTIGTEIEMNKVERIIKHCVQANKTLKEMASAMML